ncbi:MAG TPA: hypothetical protein VG713_05810 [Pirellulales bacterium]|nr:hypothetical protein [Pirellulales bacterium]
MKPKHVIAAIATVILLAGAAIWSWRSAASAAPERKLDSPEACLVAMTRASQSGDVQAYLDCFTGNLRQELDKELRDQGGVQALGERLRTSVARLKGTASYEENPATSDGAQLILERIYPQHNERWRVALRRDGQAWRVTSMAMIGSAVPPVEYGTPVFAIDAPVNEQQPPPNVDKRR